MTQGHNPGDTKVHSKGKAWSQIAHLLSLRCGRALTTAKRGLSVSKAGNQYWVTSAKSKLSWPWGDWAKVAPRSSALFARVILHGWAQGVFRGQRAGTDPDRYSVFNALPGHLHSSDVQLRLLHFQLESTAAHARQSGSLRTEDVFCPSNNKAFASLAGWTLYRHSLV